MMSLASESQENYVIEYILQRRELNGKTEYLVKWKNHSDEENTWELEEDLDCAELIRNYGRFHAPAAAPSCQEEIFSQHLEEYFNTNETQIHKVVNHVTITAVPQAVSYIPDEQKQPEVLNDTISELTPPPLQQQRQQTAKSRKLHKSNDVRPAAGSVQKTTFKRTVGEGRSKSRRHSFMHAGGGDALSSEQIKQNPFQCGYTAARILGVIPLDKVIYFLIEFNGIKDAKWVPSSMANVHIPQMVIKYYEQRLSWDLPTTNMPM